MAPPAVMFGTLVSAAIAGESSERRVPYAEMRGRALGLLRYLQDAGARPARSHGGCRSARGAARGVGGIVRIARLVRCRRRELGRHRLAHDDGIFGPAERHAGGVAERHLALENGRVVPGRHVVGVDDVFYADGNAAKYPADRVRGSNAKYTEYQSNRGEPSNG